MFFNKREYHKQVIKEQYFDGRTLWVVTYDPDNGDYAIWIGNECLGRSKDLPALKKKVKMKA